MVDIVGGSARSRFNRRNLIKMAGAGGLATALGTGASIPSQARFEIRQQQPPDDASYDVVIGGGGVSGAYAAWRLLEDDPAWRCAR